MILRVNGEIVPKEEIDQEVERLKPDYDRYVREQNAEGGEDQLREWCRENVIERVLLRQEAMKRPDPLPPEAAAPAAQGQKEEESEEQKVQRKVSALIDEVWAGVTPPPEAEVSAYYKEHKDEFQAPEQVRASHIVKNVNSPAERAAAYVAILNIKEALDQGASFEDLAFKRSDCPENAGDLGYFARGQMVQEFEDVAFAMKEDEISDVFESPFGFHIAKVYDRTSGGPIPYQQVSDRIREHLLEGRRQKALEEYVDALKQKATVEECEEVEATGETGGEVVAAEPAEAPGEQAEDTSDKE